MAFAAITAILAAYGVDRLGAYFVPYFTIVLVLITLYVSFSPKARRALSLVGLVAFGGVMVVLAFKIIDIFHVSGWFGM